MRIWGLGAVALLIACKTVSMDGSALEAERTSVMRYDYRFRDVEGKAFNSVDWNGRLTVVLVADKNGLEAMKELIRRVANDPVMKGFLETAASGTEGQTSSTEDPADTVDHVKDSLLTKDPLSFLVLYDPSVDYAVEIIGPDVEKQTRDATRRQVDNLELPNGFLGRAVRGIAKNKVEAALNRYYLNRVGSRVQRNPIEAMDDTFRTKIWPAQWLGLLAEAQESAARTLADLRRQVATYVDPRTVRMAMFQVKEVKISRFTVPLPPEATTSAPLPDTGRPPQPGPPLALKRALAEGRNVPSSEPVLSIVDNKGIVFDSFTVKDMGAAIERAKKALATPKPDQDQTQSVGRCLCAYDPKDKACKIYLPGHLVAWVWGECLVLDDQGAIQTNQCKALAAEARFKAAVERDCHGVE